MRKTLSACLVLAALAAAWAQDDADRSRILALENAWNEAETHRDVNAVDALLASTFTYTDSDGTVMDKPQFLASINAPSFDPEQIVNGGMKVQMYGPTAVVTGSYSEKGKNKGKETVRHGRFTDVWVLQNGAWHCVASQETLVGK